MIEPSADMDETQWLITVVQKPIAVISYGLSFALRKYFQFDFLSPLVGCKAVVEASGYKQTKLASTNQSKLFHN